MANKVTVTVFPVDGPAREEEIEPKLSEFQRLVGGYVEVAIRERDRLLLANEEGLVHGLPLNQHFPMFVGPLVLVASKDFK